MSVELVLGALIAWAAAKARRAGKALDGVVDVAIDASAARAQDKVRDIVLGKRESDSAVKSAVQRLETEVAKDGIVSPRTRQRVSDAIGYAADDDDPEFATALNAALDEAAKHPSLVAAQGQNAVSGTATASGQGSIASAPLAAMSAWATGRRTLIRRAGCRAARHRLSPRSLVPVRKHHQGRSAKVLEHRQRRGCRHHRARCHCPHHQFHHLRPSRQGAGEKNPRSA
ncbi:hypothetical protein [Amycolatopsis sp. NPDC003861]